MAFTSQLTAGQMYSDQLEPVRGWWDINQLTRVVPRTASQPAGAPTAIKPGMVGFLNSLNEWVFAPASGDQTNLMPIYAWTGENDFDAARYEGNLSNQSSPIPDSKVPSGVTKSNLNQKDVGIGVFIATGAYELGTTQVVSSAPAPGVLVFAEPATGKLQAIAAGSLNAFYGSSSGQAKKVPVGMSLGVKKNQHLVNMLYFYTMFWPAA